LESSIENIKAGEGDQEKLLAPGHNVVDEAAVKLWAEGQGVACEAAEDFMGKVADAAKAGNFKKVSAKANQGRNSEALAKGV
jgi:hypothetical protein